MNDINIVFKIFHSATGTTTVSTMDLPFEAAKELIVNCIGSALHAQLSETSAYAEGYATPYGPQSEDYVNNTYEETTVNFRGSKEDVKAIMSELFPKSLTYSTEGSV